MRLVKLEGIEGPLYLNPEHVIMVKKGMRDTRIETVAGHHTVKEEPEIVVRLLGAGEVARDVTPSLTRESPR
jgi:hypothetical protein